MDGSEISETKYSTRFKGSVDLVHKCLKTAITMAALYIDDYIKRVGFNFWDHIEMLAVTLEELELLISSIVTLAESNLIFREINTDAICWG